MSFYIDIENAIAEVPKTEPSLALAVSAGSEFRNIGVLNLKLGDKGSDP